MKIWIDFANSPHVLFFRPIINQLIEQKHELIITIRDFSQTVGLAKKYGIEGTIIGKHGGRNILRKSWTITNRSIKLYYLLKAERIDIALSHNSYSQIIAGRLLGTNVVTLMDYEGQPANHLAFRLAHKVIVPEYFPDKSLRKFGVYHDKLHKYKGFKEQVYLSDFKLNNIFIDELITSCNMSTDWDINKTILITIRPPAYTALYHRFSNPLFYKLLYKLKSLKGITVILLPRDKEQKNKLKKMFPSFKIPMRPLESSDLLYYSDMIISAGGTMNREAAIFGIPVYTIFAGILPAVDKKLIEIKRMKSLLNEDDINKIEFKKKKDINILKNESLPKEIIKLILK